jgi:hypothetical protein
MADYSKMYLKLFNAVTDAIRLLQSSQIDTEEMYADHEPVNITLLRPKVDDANVDDSGDDDV